jgi:Type II CAAX prenyl endopeptidase Rce1-like
MCSSRLISSQSRLHYEGLAQKWGSLFTVFLPGVILQLVHTNLWEELGWTGYLQSALQERRGPLLASLMVAPVFALFHLPAFFVSGWIADEGPCPGQERTQRRFHGTLLEKFSLRLLHETGVESQPQLDHLQGVALCQRLAQMLDRWVVPHAAVFDGTQFDARRNNNNVVPDVNRVAARRYDLFRHIVQDQL